jgi:hypothetical protein
MSILICHSVFTGYFKGEKLQGNVLAWEESRQSLYPGNRHATRHWYAKSSAEQGTGFLPLPEGPRGLVPQSAEHRLTTEDVAHLHQMLGHLCLTGFWRGTGHGGGQHGTGGGPYVR